VHTSYGYCVSQFGRRPLETFWIDSTLTQLHFYVIVSRWQVSISNPRNLTQNWYCSSWVEGSRLQLLEEFRGGSAIPDRNWNHCLGLKREKNFGPTAKLFWDLYRSCHLHATMLVNALDLCHITQNPTPHPTENPKPSPNREMGFYLQRKAHKFWIVTICIAEGKAICVWQQLNLCHSFIFISKSNMKVKLSNINLQKCCLVWRLAISMNFSVNAESF